MPPISKRQILVVDDDPGIRESLGMLLASEGYDVATADDGISAVSQLNRTVPDLIVTDLEHATNVRHGVNVACTCPLPVDVDCRDEWRLPRGRCACRYHRRQFLSQRTGPQQSAGDNRELDRCEVRLAGMLNESRPRPALDS